MFEDIRLPLSLLAAAVLSAGCASYAVPGRPADLEFLMGSQEEKDSAADERPAQELSLQEILARRPALTFPTSIAAVRLQAADYRSRSAHDGQATRAGRFTVVTMRDVESESLERLRELPQVSGLASVNRMIVPERIDSEVDLRKIAARLHADVLLVYTLDTSEERDDENPLVSALTFGFARKHEIEVRTTASAALFDTRTGYCYGLAEGSASRNPHTSWWTWEEKADDARLAAEREAFARLVDDFATTWTDVVGTYGGAVPTQ